MWVQRVTPLGVCAVVASRFGKNDIGTYMQEWTVFVCVAALAILDRLDIVDTDALSWWLSERQLPNGGLNGRPQKLEDVGSI